jgi:hypothetical protein
MHLRLGVDLMARPLTLKGEQLIVKIDMSSPCLDLLQYPDGSASLILAASESEKRAPSLFNSELAHSLLAKALDKQAIINELRSEYMVKSPLSDVSLCGEIDQRNVHANLNLHVLL